MPQLEGRTSTTAYLQLFKQLLLCTVSTQCCNHKFLQQSTSLSPQLFLRNFVPNGISAIIIFFTTPQHFEEILLHNWISIRPQLIVLVRLKKIAELKLRSFKIWLPQFRNYQLDPDLDPSRSEIICFLSGAGAWSENNIGCRSGAGQSLGIYKKKSNLKARDEITISHTQAKN
jgi:hypothetical protein